MSERWQDESWARTDEFWYSGKVTRRRFVGMGVAAAGALGASMLVPAPWRAAYGQAKAFKLDHIWLAGAQASAVDVIGPCNLSWETDRATIEKHFDEISDHCPVVATVALP